MKQEKQEEQKTSQTHKEIADKIFASSTGFKEVFITSDGLAFASENGAKNHIKSLKDKNITHIKKE